MDEGNGKESSLSVPGFRGIILKIIVVCRTKLFEFFPRAIFKIFGGIIILILFFL